MRPTLAIHDIADVRIRNAECASKALLALSGCGAFADFSYLRSIQFSWSWMNLVRLALSIWTSVRELFRTRGPAAIARLVISGIVDSLQRVALRSFSHIREEILKRVFPPIADRDVAVDVRVFGVGCPGSVAHRRPNRIQLAPAAIHAMAVSDGAARVGTCEAAFLSSASKLIGADFECFPTVADAIPKVVTFA